MSDYWILFLKTYEGYEKGQFRKWGYHIHTNGTSRYEIFQPGVWWK